MYFEICHILWSTIFSINCFKSGPFGFFFLISDVMKGLCGRERQEVVFVGHVNQKVWRERMRTGQDTERELAQEMCKGLMQGYR